MCYIDVCIETIFHCKNDFTKIHYVFVYRFTGGDKEAKTWKNLNPTELLNDVADAFAERPKMQAEIQYYSDLLVQV